MYSQPREYSAAKGDGASRICGKKPASVLTLSGFEAALRLIDDVDAAFAAHDAIVAVTAAQGFQ
jgi:hypothetical protein